MSKCTISVTTDTGRERVKAFRVGRFAVHAGLDGDGSTVTHIPTGRALIKVEDEAMAFAIADDASRFAEADPASKDPVRVARQLGPRLLSWISAIDRGLCGGSFRDWQRTRTAPEPPRGES